ncbi:MAG TPA: hypothetical protein QF753_12410 [Victivallales bacterium]|nr:hypothetical protein [Victivallales bacterium]
MIYTNSEKNYIYLCLIAGILLFFLSIVLEYFINVTSYVALHPDNITNLLFDTSFLITLLLIGLLYFNSKGLFRAYKRGRKISKFILAEVVIIIYLALFNPVISYNFFDSVWIILEFLACVFFIFYFISIIE